jgi:hypothetical protein
MLLKIILFVAVAAILGIFLMSCKNEDKMKKQLESQFGDKFKIEDTQKKYGGVFIPVADGETVFLSDKNGIVFTVAWKDDAFLGDIEALYQTRLKEVALQNTLSEKIAKVIPIKVFLQNPGKAISLSFYSRFDLMKISQSERGIIIEKIRAILKDFLLENNLSFDEYGKVLLNLVDVNSEDFAKSNLTAEFEQKITWDKQTQHYLVIEDMFKKEKSTYYKEQFSENHIYQNESLELELGQTISKKLNPLYADELKNVSPSTNPVVWILNQKTLTDCYFVYDLFSPENAKSQNFSDRTASLVGKYDLKTQSVSLVEIITNQSKPDEPHPLANAPLPEDYK